MHDYTPNEMMRPAFFIDCNGISDSVDLTIPPATAQEYLQRVISEASVCDKIVVAAIDPAKIRPQKHLEILPGLQEASKALIPSQEWQECQVSDFSTVRNRLLLKIKAANNKIVYRMPGLRDEKGWRKVCIGSNEENSGNFEMTPPLLRILLNPNMSQHLLLKVLEYNVSWLENGFSVNQAKWLYALLACLEMPLYPETCSLLRELARECARIRALLDSPEHEFVAPLNLLICLVSKYYRQLDLAE